MKNDKNFAPAVSVRLNSFSYSGYEEVPVLHDIDFPVEYGKVTLLSGMSGCGKSTLLSLINGVIPRMTSGEIDGEIRICGENTAEWSMSRISRKVGSVLQNAESQIIHQRVEDEIAFACENFAVPPEEIELRVAQSCELMKLEKVWKTRTLSGGQKQRIVTASTLAMDTNILLFDEPLANLDCAGADDLLTLLKELAAQGKAVLIIEHRLDMVLPYVDEVWQMQDGTVSRVEDRAEFFQNQINVIHDPLTGENPGGRVGTAANQVLNACLNQENPGERVETAGDQPVHGTGQEERETSQETEKEIRISETEKESGVQEKDTQKQLFLRLENVRKSFGSREILKNVSADIFEGDRILLLGENGCGKSTLLKILARLLSADGGEITPYFWLEGSNPYHKKKQTKKWFQQVGVIYQNPDYQLFMPSVREEILFGAADDAYALEVADRFGLTGLLERHPHSLSEGQKRRVTVAAILAQKPKLLLMDEPTVGQDYEGLQRLLTVTNEIHVEQNNTMISVSHDFRCADALCDRVLWLQDGEIFREGGKELVVPFFKGKRNTD